VDVLLSIGEFSKMTYLTVKSLRHYHDVDLLHPADIDSATGYRRYAVAQVATAQAIRRFRELDMPLDDIRDVLQATDPEDRNLVILHHLERMQRQLERTQMSVASLQALLQEKAPAEVDIDFRRIPASRALTTMSIVTFDNCSDWLGQALADIHAHMDGSDLEIAGVDGALYSDAFFDDGEGEVIAFLPVTGHRSDLVTIPAATVGVLVHEGPFSELDQTYAALGIAVAERGVGAPGWIREHYLSDVTTEVCWPVTLDVT
jgi:DNA-binding transcriptional MerR regulator